MTDIQADDPTATQVDDSVRPLSMRVGDAPYVVAVLIAYDGAPFAGFARQPGRDTVQGRMEEALRTALRREVLTVGAGRTDAGVHALGQLLTFDGVGDEPKSTVLRRSLDALSGDGIAVREVRRARPGFSARFDAVSREYRYRINDGMTPALFLRDVSWRLPKGVDADAMRAGAKYLLGEHDFRSFCVTESAIGKRTVRRLDQIDIQRGEELGEACLTIRVVGNAFLHSMVRTVIGTLAEVGAGRRDPSWVGEVLAAQERVAAGQTAPAHGLTLHSVTYPNDVWLP